MSFTAAVRSLGARRAPLVHTRALHSPFGAMAPRAASPSAYTERSPEYNARLNVVASPAVDKFNGVPLGAYQVSTPYHVGVDAQQAGNTLQPRESLRNTVQQGQRVSK